MWEQEIKKELEQLEGISQKRKLKIVEEASRSWLTLDNKKMLNLASNNYLGLADHPLIKAAAIDAVKEYGNGSTASRLIVGNHPPYEETEQELISWKKAEAGLIVNSGYTANLGIIASLMGRNDIVFSDKLNHASIIDGIQLSRAENRRYRHHDLNQLETMLKKAPTNKRKLIVTDAIFSMDGDFAKLADLVTLKKRYNAILLVDEAHSSGVYGANGEGYIHELKLQDQIDIQMGTFSKALGCFGAYIVGSKWFIDYLINKMRSFIYTTALPPAVLGSVKEAMKLVQKEPDRRERLLQLSTQFRENLVSFGFDICGSESQIVPIRIGGNKETLRFSERLQEEGIAAIAVRPPTVPENEARVRFTITSEHSKLDLEKAAEKVAHVGKKLGVI